MQQSVQTDTFREAQECLRSAVLRRALDEPVELAPLLRGKLALRPHTVDLAADTAMRDAAHENLLHGWKPAELRRFGARRLDATQLSYLVDALAATITCSYSSAWLSDLKRLGATPWWSPGQPHLSQWARRHAVSRLDAVRTAVEVLALITYLPRTDEVRAPAPVRALPEVPAGTLVADPRALARIEALLNRAASSVFAEEAAACARKAQELMVRYAAVPAEREGELTLLLRQLFAQNPVTAARRLLAGLQSSGREPVRLADVIHAAATREITGRTA